MLSSCTGSAIGSGGDSKVSLNQTITLVKGINKIDLLSVTVGLQNYGAFYDKRGAGIISPVLLIGKSASANLSSSEWTYQVPLLLSSMLQKTQRKHWLPHSCCWIRLDFKVKTRASTIQEIHQYGGIHKLTCQSMCLWCGTRWVLIPPNLSYDRSYRILHLSQTCFLQTEFEAPAGNDPVAVDFVGMGKGMAWVNGESIGRYWPSYLAPESGCEPCDYRGSYDSNKCRKNCGQPSQTL